MSNGKSVVCTVFEKNYHFGVGGLANSLYACGFRGVLYAGYRGELPPWVEDLELVESGGQEYLVAEGFKICFALQDTDEMLANIKPEIIEQVWERFGETIENVFYIDCDIVIKAEWSHFVEWVDHGIALVEDMHSPVFRQHPLREQWRQYYAKFGIDYVAQDDIYVNGGFVGINRRYRPFVKLWGQLQDYMKLQIGKQDRIGIADRWNMFHYTDQDALNVAKDLTDKVSIMGKDAMDFGKYGYVMSHAAGILKPWHKTYLRDIIITGARPSFADKLYWQHVDGPVRLYPSRFSSRKRSALKVAALIGRFFTKT